MYFEGNPVKNIGSTDLSTVQKIVECVEQKYKNKWQKRTLKALAENYTLKAITPTQNDRVDSATSNDLEKFLLPLICPFVGPSEKIIYLDLSLMPPLAKTDVHFDFAWIHVLSRRIVIPLKTNSRAILSVLSEDNKIKNFNLKAGGVYEFNNQLFHLASNFGTEDRINIIADVIDFKALNYLVESKKLEGIYCGKLNSTYLSPRIVKKFLQSIEQVLQVKSNFLSHELF